MTSEDPRSEPGAEGLREADRAAIREAFVQIAEFDNGRGVVNTMVAILDAAFAAVPFPDAATPAADSRGLDVERLARALHIEWDTRIGEPSEPDILCGDCMESAVRVLREYAALTDPDPAPDSPHDIAIKRGREM